MAAVVVIKHSSKKETLLLFLLLFLFRLEVSGNSNNCILPPVKGACEAHMPRFFYNATSSQCEQFIYGGCGGNANNFYTLNECLKECNESICTLPQVSGPCEAYSEQFYYNSFTAKCEKLIYGGCGGNQNRFPTYLQCMMECGAPSFCHLPAYAGPCDTEPSISGYFFNSSSAKCEEFVFGSCKGNVSNGNRFITVDECRMTCPDRCTFPPETGLCEAYFPRYYYNFDKKRCEKFVYGGCGGNANRFVSERECLATCSGNANFGSVLMAVMGLSAMVFITYH